MFFTCRALTKAWGGNTTMSLLALLDLKRNSPFLVFVFLVLFIFCIYTQNPKKNSVVLLLKKLWEAQIQQKT
jgi:hypothetical protein